MRIWLKPDKMKQYGLIPSDITKALDGQNIEAAPGKFGENSDMAFEYVLRYKGRLKTIPDYENIIISSSTNGQTLKLGDVAKVELGGLQYNVNLLNNGHPAVLGMVNQVAGSNATQIASDVKTALEEAKKSFPPGLEYTIEQDVTEFLFASIHGRILSLLQEVKLAMHSYFITLQPKNQQLRLSRLKS